MRKATGESATSITVAAGDREPEAIFFTIGPDGAARYIGVSKPTLYRHIRAGRLKAIRFGGRTLIKRTDLEAMIEEAAR